MLPWSEFVRQHIALDCLYIYVAKSGYTFLSDVKYQDDKISTFMSSQVATRAFLPWGSREDN